MPALPGAITSDSSTGALGDLPRDCVLTSTTANDKHLHINPTPCSVWLQQAAGHGHDGTLTQTP